MLMNIVLRNDSAKEVSVQWSHHRDSSVDSKYLNLPLVTRPHYALFTLEVEGLIIFFNSIGGGLNSRYNSIKRVSTWFS